MAWFAAGIARPDVIGFALPISLRSWVGLTLSLAKSYFYLSVGFRQLGAVGYWQR
jgi:hypothetical protein